jgi:hypothetical protein
MAREHSAGETRSQKQTAGSVIWAGVLAGLGRPAVTGGLAACLAETTTWPDIVAEARRLRVAPLVYAGLQATDASRISRGALEALRRTTLMVGARSARLEETTASVIAAAADAGISVLILKGLALQNLTYPAGILRPMDDVDLLVSAADRPRLGHMLRSRGYRNDLRGEEDFFASDLSHSIDLHTHLVNTTRVPARGALWDEPFQRLWERRQPFLVGDVPAWTLGPQDTTWHLAVHAVHHHGLHGVLWMVDLLAASRAWPAAFVAVDRAPAGVRRSVWYCLEVLAARGQDPVPTARVAVRPKWLFPGERRVLSHTAREAECASHVRYGLTLACLPRWTSKVAFATQLVFPSDGVYAAGFADAGQPVQHTWIRHWRDVAGLVTNGRRRNRTEPTPPVDCARMR